MSYYSSIYGDLPKEYTKARYDSVAQLFALKFGKVEAVFTASGRCELLGNHTDHNNGKVLVSAINRDIIGFAKKNNTDVINIISDFGQICLNCNEIAKRQDEINTSLAIVRGILKGFSNNNYIKSGFDCVCSSNIPYASGLSSSAAFEILIGNILNGLFNNNSIGKMQLAKIGQYAENEYFGKPCGLLDQCGVSYGKLSYIDFANPSDILVKTLSVKLDRQILLIKTLDDHAKLGAYYAQIKDDMVSVAKIFGKNYLRQVDEQEFMAYYNCHEKTRELKRSFHFFNENNRVELAYTALTKGDLPTFYNLVNQSGISSRDYLGNCSIDNETNSPLLAIIEGVKDIYPDCAVRVHGGGFRGSVLAFVNKDAKKQLILEQKFGKENILEVGFNISLAQIEIDKLF
ncbi:MAG: galactokinase family protein [Clostridia bacterium]